MRLFVYILGALVSMLIILGSLFKIMQWSGAESMLILGMSIAAIIFVPLFSVYRYKKGNTMLA